MSRPMITTNLSPLPDLLLEPIVRMALGEDLLPSGDITSDCVIEHDTRVELHLRAREAGVFAGCDAAQLAARLVDPAIQLDWKIAEGGALVPGAVVGVLAGNARKVLMVERTVLNFLGHLSGVATTTSRYVAAVAGTRAKVTCTRKTTPGLRIPEKRAVLLGGGSNHRFSLGDALLIKDNHIVAAGGLRSALERARERAGHMRIVEVEVDTLEQLVIALEYRPDCILLDNMPLDILCEAVRLVAGRCTLEASGGITLETIADVAKTGVDYISVGALTHSARRLDFGLDAPN